MNVERAPYSYLPAVSNTQELTETYRFKLSRNVVADVKFTGTTVTANDVEMLRRFLDLMKQALGDDVSVQPPIKSETMLVLERLA